MKFPRHHYVIPSKYSLWEEKLETLQFSLPKDLKIHKAVRVENSFLWRRYQRQVQSLRKKNDRKPVEKLMYHLTSVENALEISKHGFKIQKSRMRAFGKGVNLCLSMDDVLGFHKIYRNKKNLYSVIVCQVVYYKAHANSSNDIKIITNADGSYFTAPKFMTPKKNFDSMYSDRPYKKIWIIPSQARVYPSFILNVRITS
jgi:hypothetical protein